MKGIHASSLLIALLFAIVPAALGSTTWYVDGVNGSDSNNCMSSQTACKTIKHAIKIATSGDSIMVAAATYTDILNFSISVNVIGSGAATTIIDGRHRRGSAVVTINAKAKVTLSQVTIQNGGRGISGNGNGIYNVGTVTVNDSIINGNHAGIGGGILNSGTVTLSNSTLSGNQGKNAGGIVNSGTMTINNSTLSNNFAPEGPGAVSNMGGTLTINNSTLSGNRAYVGGGGLITNQGGATVTINNSTLSGNSVRHGAAGGIVGTATLQNTILANNTGGNCYGGVTSSGYSLSSDATCNFNGPGDVNNTDPKLGPLQDNGGPTQTMALLSGSPAIDAGNPNGCRDNLGQLLTTDQRGQPRPDKEDKGGCDMGAYESQ